MTPAKSGIARHRHPSAWLAISFLLLAAAIWLFASGPAQAATPAAGTRIGNQASATYTDTANVTRTVTSNTVTTVVQQVAALTLTTNGAKQVTPGGQVAYPHALTNTGNGADSFNLATSNGGDVMSFTLTRTAGLGDENIPFGGGTKYRRSSTTDVSPGTLNSLQV